MTSWHPHAYQLEAMKRGLEQPALGYFMAPGLGKTAVTLGLLKLLLHRGQATGALVISPLRVAAQTWPAEARKWAEFAELRLELLHGSKKVEAWEREADVYVINPEGLPWLRRQFPTQLKGNLARHRQRFDVLVVDESTRFKHAGTVRMKLMRQLLPLFRRRYLLTGTPAPNGLLDLWGQAYLLDGGLALGRYFTQYRSRYFEVARSFGPHVHDWRPRAGAQALIERELAPLVHRVDADDVLDLPELVVRDVPVTLPPRARQAYRTLERELVLQLEQGLVVAGNAAARTSKLRQLANGGLYLNEPRQAQEVHEAKAQAAAALVAKEPCLVAYEFRHDLERLRSALGQDVPHIGGDVTARRGRELCELWNRGQLDCLLVQPQSAAHGLNLQEGPGRTVVFFGLPWDLEAYLQLIQRVHRQGQRARRVFVHRLIAEGTVDEDVIAALASKARGQQALLNAFRRRVG